MAKWSLNRKRGILRQNRIFCEKKMVTNMTPILHENVPILHSVGHILHEGATLHSIESSPYYYCKIKIKKNYT